MAPGPSRFAASALDLGPAQWAAPTWGADSISRAAQTTPAHLLHEPSQAEASGCRGQGRTLVLRPQACTCVCMRPRCFNHCRNHRPCDGVGTFRPVGFCGAVEPEPREDRAAHSVRSPQCF